MLIRTLIILVLCLSMAYSNAYATDADGQLQFIANKGQWDERVQYKANLPGGAVFFTGDAFRYCFYEAIEIPHTDGIAHSEQDGRPINGHAYDMKLLNIRQSAITGEDILPAYHNYFIGKDSSKWQGNVPLYNTVKYNEVYEHIDMKIYSQAKSLKYDFVVAPGGRVNDIQIAFDGVTPVLSEKGDLLIKTTVNEVVEMAPYAYQVINGIETEVPCTYSLKDGVLTFILPAGYDENKTLIIDPVLVYSTYTGSTNQLFGYCSAYGLDGAFYSATQAWYTSGYPVTIGAFQTVNNTFDIAINKYLSDGAALAYSTYCGGILRDLPTNMYVNSFNELVVTGMTYSVDFPVTTTAFDTSHNGELDIFVTVFNNTGSALIGSTYIGGAGDDGLGPVFIQLRDADKSGLVTDGANNIYVASASGSANFPVTNGAYDVSYDAVKDGVVMKLPRNCSSLIFSTFLGGNADDGIYDCKLTRNNDIVLSGLTNSNNFPVTSGAYSNAGKGFVSILNSSGSSLLASTKLGPHSGAACRVSLDDSGNVFVSGNNDSAYAVSPGVYYHQGGKVFIAKLTADLDSMIKTTKLFNVPTPGVTGMTNVCNDIVGSVYLEQTNTNFPVSSNAHRTSPATHYLYHMSPDMDSMIYTTYFGVNHGSCHSHGHANAIDTNGVIWMSICISQVKNQLAGTVGSFSPSTQSGSDSSDFFSAKFDMEVLAAKPVALPKFPDTTCSGLPTVFDNESRNAYSYIWRFGDGDTSHAAKPSHVYQNVGPFVVTLEAYNPYSCKQIDVVVDTIHVDSVKITSSMIIKDSVCRYAQNTYFNNSVNGLTYLWDFGDGTTDTSANAMHTYYTAGTYTVKLMAYNPSICNLVDTATQTIVVDGRSPLAAFAMSDTTACAGQSVVFQNISTNANSYEWDFADGSPVSASTSPTHNYTQWGAKNVQLIATNTALCVPKDTVSNSLYILRPAEVVLNDSVICADNEITLKAQLKYINSFPEYSWEPPSAITSANDTLVVRVNPKLSQRYILTITDSIIGKCKSVIKDTVNLILVDYPTDVLLEHNAPICAGDTLVLRSSTTMTRPNLLYTWAGPDGYVRHVKDTVRYNVQPKDAGIYSITIDNQGCSVTEYADILIKSLPEVSASNNGPVLAGDDLQLKADVKGGADSFSWAGPAGFVSNVKNPVIDAVGSEAAGTYTVQVFHDGCTSDDITVVTIDEPDSQYVRLYPNPNGGRFFIEGRGFFDQVVNLRIVNAVGQDIYREDINTDGKKFKHDIKLSGAASGVYIMWVLMDAEQWRIPFVILRE